MIFEQGATYSTLSVLEGSIATNRLFSCPNCPLPPEGASSSW